MSTLNIASGEVKEGLAYRLYADCDNPNLVYLDINTKTGCLSCTEHYHKETVKIPLEVYLAISNKDVVGRVSQNNAALQGEIQLQKKTEDRIEAEQQDAQTVTCLKCGNVHMAVSVELAIEAVNSFNLFYRQADEAAKACYGNKPASLNDYVVCSKCGNNYHNFRPSLPNDCPSGCTLSPILHFSSLLEVI